MGPAYILFFHYQDQLPKHAIMKKPFWFHKLKIRFRRRLVCHFLFFVKRCAFHFFFADSACKLSVSTSFFLQSRFIKTVNAVKTKLLQLYQWGISKKKTYNERKVSLQELLRIVSFLKNTFLDPPKTKETKNETEHISE